MSSSKSIEEGIEKSGLPTAKRHLFLCLGPECCDMDEGEEVWKFLKKHVKNLDLEVMRTKAGCLRICTGGPWLVVYPDGIWYGGVTVERCRVILEQHIRDGRGVAKWIAATNPLCLGERLPPASRPS